MRAENALKSIDTGAFKVGRLLEFNDPFEWQSGVKNLIPEGEEIARRQMHSFVEEMNDKFGVLCFSATSSEPVLWSHYADNHRGVAFEFSYLEKSESLIKIEYSDDRPTVDANRLNNPIGLDDYLLPILNRLICWKSSGWRYEQEMRSFTHLNNCRLIGEHYFQDIPRDNLTRIILGSRCNLVESDMVDLLRKNGFDKCAVGKARMCLETSKILC